MRILLFFDLPTLTIANKRNYTHFRKTLIKNGFFMMQESVYCKIALNMTNVNTIMRILEENKPDEGFIQILVITEKQFEKMITLLGDFETETLNTDERLVIL
ncbi:MAG: CRISPR-associated endonuclease Cas2 [Fusobacteriales bacterium]|nr:MAG: CRISPR-associated endonuclease Cas2 [Fusobacteriales bacterium]